MDVLQKYNLNLAPEVWCLCLNFIRTFSKTLDTISLKKARSYASCLIILYYSCNLFNALKIARIDALVILELTPTPNVVLPVFKSNK